MIAFLDTHAFISLANGKVDRFGAASRRLMTAASLRVTPIVLLEMHYLHEIGQLAPDPDPFYLRALDECGAEESLDSFAEVVREAKSLAWTRDPFDRLIVGAAMVHRAKLVTKDSEIHEHFDGAVW